MHVYLNNTYIYIYIYLFIYLMGIVKLVHKLFVKVQKNLSSFYKNKDFKLKTTHTYIWIIDRCLINNPRDIRVIN
jgi:hypothetical protein